MVKFSSGGKSTRSRSGLSARSCLSLRSGRSGLSGLSGRSARSGRSGRARLGVVRAFLGFRLDRRNSPLSGDSPADGWDLERGRGARGLL